jgi:hypothetical protein
MSAPIAPEAPSGSRSTLVAMRVKIDPVNHSVEVEGTDISGVVRRATVDLHAGRPPEVFLELAAGKLAPDVLEADGVVHVVRDADDTDHRSIVLAWLAGVDSEALERAVLEDVDLGQSTSQSFLTQLAKLAANG